MLAHLDTLRAYLRTHQQARASQVVKDLTPIVRGWVHFYHHSASAETFKTASHRLWVMLWTWAKRGIPTSPATGSSGGTSRKIGRSTPITGLRPTPPPNTPSPVFQGGWPEFPDGPRSPGLLGKAEDATGGIACLSEVPPNHAASARQCLCPLRYHVLARRHDSRSSPCSSEHGWL